jgi:hypothetical protein
MARLLVEVTKVAEKVTVHVEADRPLWHWLLALSGLGGVGGTAYWLLHR